MTWIQELPFFVRMLPVGLMLLSIVAVFVFMALRPVDGEIILAETISENRAGIAIGLVLTVVSIVPSMAVFVVALMASVAALFALRNESILERLEFARL